MAHPFELGILFGDKPDRPPGQIAPGWDFAEVPVALQIQPFESNANWEKKKQEITSWNLPPIRVASHFIQFWGLSATGPGVDWEQNEFWSKRAFERMAELGVKVAGVYGGFFRIHSGYSRTELLEQALRFANTLADHAREHDITVALEPIAELDTLWPRYLDGLAFAKELGRPEIRVMADLNYFLKIDQPFSDIAIDPEYCMHCHIAENNAQPGAGDREDVLVDLFRVLRDAGYERGVSAACVWVSTEGGEIDFGAETGKALRYLQDLRARVYAE